MSETTIVVDDGTRLRVRVDGPVGGPALLLLGSLGADASMWDPQVAAWGATRRLVRVDPRGHGASDAPSGPYTIERLGADAASVLDATGIARADVCGVSLGGAVALWLAGTAPDRVRRLVLADTAARIGTDDAWRQRAATVREQGMAAVADLVIERFFSPGFRATGDETLEEMRRTLLATDPEGYAASCEALATGDLRGLLPAVTAPTLVVVGTDDVATPPADARALVEGLGDARLLELAGAGHLANLERPTAFADAVADFLAPADVATAGEAPPARPRGGGRP